MISLVNFVLTYSVCGEPSNREQFRILLFSASSNRNRGHHPFKSENFFFVLTFLFCPSRDKGKKKVHSFFFRFVDSSLFFLHYKFICVLFRLQSSWLTFISSINFSNIKEFHNNCLCFVNNIFYTFFDEES
jgi:hypothetical protein